MYPGTKFKSIWRTLVFATKCAQKALKGGVVRQTQLENNLFLEQNTLIWLASSGFWVVSAGFS